VLVIGCGSIGERHVRTLLATGRAGVVACDNRPAIREAIASRYGVATTDHWEPALADPAVSPAPLHVAMATRCLQAGRHVLCEKPLSLNLDGVDALIAARAASQKFCGVAYVLHFLPALSGARAFLQTAPFGAIRHVAVNSGQHFPQFRPAYREIYYRDRAQGGGAIQDALTHLANAVEWVAGPTQRVYCDADHQVLEGVTVEDTVVVSARNGGALVSYSLNQFQAPNESRWDFHAEMGSVRVETATQRWGSLLRGETEWNWRSAPVPERDAIYLAQANAFLDGCAGLPNPLCTLEEGRQTLRFNVACLESCQSHLPVEL
jgi:predicted dehydrogenase